MEWDENHQHQTFNLPKRVSFFFCLRVCFCFTSYLLQPKTKKRRERKKRNSFKHSHLIVFFLMDGYRYVASDTPLIMDSLLDLVPDWNLFHLSQSKTKNLSLMAHPHEYSQKHFHAHVKSERINYSRGLIIDLNFLGGDDWDLIKVEGSNSKKIQQKVLFFLFSWV